MSNVSQLDLGLQFCGQVHDDDILFRQMFDLSDREIEWVLNVQKSKISADDFYHKHRFSSLGEFSHRSYVLARIEAIRLHTSAENYERAFQMTLFPSKGLSYEVPIEFTRFLLKSIRDRAVFAQEKNKNAFFGTFDYIV